VIQAALLGGAFIGILSALPIINVANCCCLWVIAGGVLAAHLDRQNDPRPMTIGRGAFAGLTAGIVGALVWLIVSLALDPLLTPLQERMADAMVRNARDMPPEARVWLESIGSRAESPVRWVLGFLFHLLAGAIFATLGGMFAAMVFGRNNAPPALGGTTFPPPPPIPGGG
jgi:hypothetical protein